MKKHNSIGIWGIMVLVFLAMTSCRKNIHVNTPIVGHWGCEQYVSCSTDDMGVEQWDTLLFEACEGGEYELFFYENGQGKLKLNNSPAFIKEFSCDYEYDSVNQLVIVEGSSWLYALYGTIYSIENHAEFNLETVTDTTFVASWTNHVSEPKPFFERFFIKRID